MLTGRLVDNAYVLDIGCGPGVPITKALAREFRVIGVDISGEQIKRARLNVPNAIFFQDDIMSMRFEDRCFDAVTSFYTIFHIPREEHALLFRKIQRWLKPGGYLLVTLAFHEECCVDDFWGARMYWSNYGLEYYRSTLRQIGFNLLEVVEVGHGYKEEVQVHEERHPLIFAQLV